MGLFSSLFGKNDDKKTTIKTSSVTYNPTPKEVVVPSLKAEYKPIVLYWISKKKKGYDFASNKYPKWFYNNYGIDFNSVASEYINSGYISNESNILTVSEEGEQFLKTKSHVIFVYEHPEYEITISDIEKSPNFGKVKNNDIAWGIFNQRTMDFTRKLNWQSLANNYSNMAKLLIEESKFENALDFIFATAYIETSGMGDNNNLTPIWTELKNNKWVDKYLPTGTPDIEFLEINNYRVTIPFLDAQKELQLSWDEIRNRFLNSKYVESAEQSLPFKYFEKEEAFIIFKQAVNAGRDKGIFKLSEVDCKLKYNKPNPNSKTYFYANTENKVGIKLSR